MTPQANIFTSQKKVLGFSSCLGLIDIIFVECNGRCFYFLRVALGASCFIFKQNVELVKQWSGGMTVPSYVFTTLPES